MGGSNATQQHSKVIKELFASLLGKQKNALWWSLDFCFHVLLSFVVFLADVRLLLFIGVHCMEVTCILMSICAQLLIWNEYRHLYFLHSHAYCNTFIK